MACNISFGFNTEEYENVETCDSSDSDEERENQPPENTATSRKARGRPRGSKTARIAYTGDKNDYFPSHMKHQAPKKSRIVPIENIRAVICCENQCLGRGLAADFRRARNSFQEMTRNQQGQWILDYLSSHSNWTDAGPTFTFNLGTSNVCCIAWRLAYGISQSRYYRKIETLKAGGVAMLPADYSRKGCLSTATNTTIAWLNLFSRTHGDKMPDEEERIHLPSCLTRKDVYQMCQVHIEAEGEIPCSESHFYKLWNTHCADITIPKVNRFAICTKCSDFSTRLQAYKNPHKREALTRKRNKHLDYQRAEREKYYKHAAKARRNPDKYMCLIVDGMDQSKTYLPHFLNLNKAISQSWKLKVHLTGVKVHGTGLFVFADTGEYDHSSNLLLNVLVNILGLRKDHIPEVLYLQLDNCWRENKNRYIFAFLCYLVELGVFRKVKVNFLMVGHTHEDIDQFFSKISGWLMKHTAGTLEELLAGVEECTKPKPEATVTTTMYNIRDWLAPCIAKPMQHHSGPHQFRIKKNPDTGKAMLTYKNWSTYKSYIEPEGTGAPLSDTPHGEPEEIAPNYDKIDLNRLRVDVNALTRFMMLDKKESYRETWAKWFDEANSRSGGDYLSEENWQFPEVVEYILSKRANPATGPHSEADQNGETISDLSDEDEPLPLVRIGKRLIDTSNWREEMEQRILQQGDLCLLDMAKWAGYAGHQIGKVLEIHEDDSQRVTIEWMKAPIGKKITTWPGQWKETVNRSTIYYHGFVLTSRDYLPQCVKDIIEEYESSF